MALKGVPKSPEHAAKLREVCHRMNDIRRKQATHFLSNLNHDNLTADCSLCGRVPLKVSTHNSRHRKGVQYTCWIGGTTGKPHVAYLNQALDMWESQAGHCALCHEPMQRSGRAQDGVTLDHDHHTGVVRGFLHQKCNKGLGHFDDDPALLQLAFEYLKHDDLKSLL